MDEVRLVQMIGLPNKHLHTYRSSHQTMIKTGFLKCRISVGLHYFKCLIALCNRVVILLFFSLESTEAFIKVFYKAEISLDVGLVLEGLVFVRLVGKIADDVRSQNLVATFCHCTACYNFIFVEQVSILLQTDKNDAIRVTVLLELIEVCLNLRLDFVVVSVFRNFKPDESVTELCVSVVHLQVERREVLRKREASEVLLAQWVIQVFFRLFFYVVTQVIIFLVLQDPSDSVFWNHIIGLVQVLHRL
jgi:hypothetical protein